ncbi:hypothetical protein HY971_03335 [Candidatus Kaiserbacteria bacterium]|nr:hypothetical protein [Candidatus Kaiserbacteria bacterium]
MEILIVREPVPEETLDALAEAWHGTLVKGAADIERDIVALGGDWHMDANNVLIADGSQQENVWGFNIYPKERSGSALEYISLINIRPAQGNKAMELADETLREKIKEIVSKLVPHLNL